MSLPTQWQELAVGTTLTSQLASDGLYDDLRVYNRPLPASQIQDLFNGTINVYVPPSDPSEDHNRNWTLERSFDGNGNVIGESKQFSDALGRPTQSQAKSMTSKHVFASQNIYNAQGKPALSTLPAPTNNQEFNYREDFIKDNTGQLYSDAAFEGVNSTNPLPVENTSIGTLGYYYGTNNVLEPYTATSTHPFSLAEAFTDPIGGVKRATGPGDEFRMGSGREGKARQFMVLDELEHYLSLRQYFVPGTPAGATYKYNAFKTVNISPDGKESIIFSDASGQTLAACLSGAEYAPIELSALLEAPILTTEPLPYREIHVPAAGDIQLTITPNTWIVDGASGYVLNLQDNTRVSFSAPNGNSPATIPLRPGFYRIVAQQGSMTCRYPVRYGHFSYTYYDDAGRGVASVAPAGVDRNSTAAPNHVTRSLYDGLGQLLRATSTDEGEARYVYAQDGRVRFSQSAQQLADHSFSYVNYDRAGRAVETGVYAENTADPSQGLIFEDHLTTTLRANSVLQPQVLENRTRAGGLNAAQCREQHSTWYDQMPDAVPGSRTPRFLVGATAKTSNVTAATWYSYDELGRVEWMVQQLQALGTKTVDYTYDFNGNVLEVAYQKGQPDAFYHHYQYDADQRLSAVYTSPDGGEARALQARYYYYLHGPLKRVELANRLQGVDYLYTVQGWLKSINHMNTRLDPGQDSPKARGIPKDLFALTLNYFGNDYGSAKLPASSVLVPGRTASRYDGTIADATWRTASSVDRHTMAYQYDTKGQLLQADYGKLTPGSATFQLDPARGNAEGGITYDLNGNIQQLTRRNQAGTPTDEFKYNYRAASNQLSDIRHPTTNVELLRYTYDQDGQLTEQVDAGVASTLTYDAAGNVTRVQRAQPGGGNAPLVSFTYDDRGFRSTKTTYTAGTPTRTTYYARDGAGNVLSIYEQEAATGSPLVQAEIPLYGSGRVGTLVRQDNGMLDARYELNDQLGNARVVFHLPSTVRYLASMAASQAQREEQEFENVASTRFATPVASDGYVARLHAAQGLPQGPSKTLQLAKGDTVTFSAAAFFNADGSGRVALRVAPLLVAGVPNPPRPAESGEPRRNWLGRLAAGLTLSGWSARQGTPPTTGVLAYLRYRLKDAQGTVLDEQFEPVNSALPGAWQTLQLGVRAKEAGTLEVAVVSNDPARAIYFDDIQVEHTGSMIVQEQHTYAFGAPLPGLSYVVGDKRYRYGYQGQFAEKDEETGWNSFEERQYDSRIGRWLSPDPQGQFHSAYVGMGNNPVSGVDPDGGWSWIGAGAGAVVGAGIGALLDGDGSAWDGAAIGFGAGFVAGGLLGPESYRVRTASGAHTVIEPMRLNIPSVAFIPVLPVSRSRLHSLPETSFIVEYNRTTETDESTTGAFRIKGTNITGYFLESAGPSTTSSNMDKRIPSGTYNLGRHSGDRFSDALIIWNSNVPKSRAVLIHPGNFPGDTEGCFLPGSSVGVNKVGNSKPIFDRIMKQAKKNGMRNAKLIIKDPK